MFDDAVPGLMLDDAVPGLMCVVTLACKQSACYDILSASYTWPAPPRASEPQPSPPAAPLRRCQPAFWKAAYNTPMHAPASPTSVLAFQGSTGSIGSPAPSQSVLGSPDMCRHSGASSSASPQWPPADGARLEASPKRPPANGARLEALRKCVPAQGPPSTDARGVAHTRASVPRAAGKTKAARRVQRVLTCEQLLEAVALP
eukprot:293999-Chlamydomonas_euryale.AAC.7